MATATFHVDAAAAAIRNLWESGEFSDLLIRCHGQEFRVHRAIEAVSGEIELDDDPDTVSRMLSYIYTSSYDESGSKHGPGSPEATVEAKDVTKSSITPATFHASGWVSPNPTWGAVGTSDDAVTTATPPDKVAQSEKAARIVDDLTLKNNALVYAIADKYNIPLLKGMARAKFTARARKFWQGASHRSIVRTVYQTTPDNDRGLRMVVTDRCTHFLPSLIATEFFRASVLELSSFGLDMLQACLTKFKADKAELQAKLDETNKRLESANATIETALSTMQRAISCRSCKEPFHPSSSKITREALKLDLKCPKCRTAY
ncbi:MAG: hypothetical protein M1826_005426 [Phylliscum demangeonii]|nr:MAG: hypothetical protein M1826_005426 [Phylliscum demangeonii]